MNTKSSLCGLSGRNLQILCKYTIAEHVQCIYIHTCVYTITTCTMYMYI